MSHPSIPAIQAGGPIGQPFVELKSVDSTNNYAMAKVHAGLASHGTVYFAWEQTRGKGQRGKSWVSAAGKNILLSAVLEPGFLELSDQFALSSAIGLACFDFLSQYIPEDLTIKWPNDLYWRDRKAGGILIESICQGRNWLFAIAGIGMNINQTDFPKSGSHAISLSRITGNVYEPVALARELCRQLELKYERLRQNGKEELLAQYNQHLYKRNQKVNLKKGDECFEATILGVNAQGQLLARTDRERLFDFGELEWLI